MFVIYTIGIYLYQWGIFFASFFHPKAKKWVEGRRTQQHIWRAEHHRQNQGSVWFHCASLGEFEQGRNLIESIRTLYPQKRIVVTFFSPSGYEIRKNYPLADEVLYLPADTPHNVQAFIDYVNPEVVFFVKYELWLGYLKALQSRQIKVLLIAASVRQDSAFFRSPFRKLYRDAFASFAAIFTQNALTAQLIQAFSQNPNVYISGDTRYDRVLSNAREFQPLLEIERFINQSPQNKKQRVIVCGSAWAKEIEIMMQILPQLPDNYKVIIAPHEIHPKEIERYMAQFPLLSIRFSEIQSLAPAHKVLWIDNIGMLSRLYHYADVAFIGGGFQKALHNILEAAVFGCVVVFGSNFHPKKYPEGEALIATGGAFVIDTAADMMGILHDIETQHLYTKIRTLNQDFVVQQSGATTQIVDFCQQMHWLS